MLRALERAQSSLCAIDAVGGENAKDLSGLRCGWSWGSVKTTRSDWLARKEINLLLQIALQGAGDLPNVPLVTDFAKADRDKQILRLILSRQQMA